jgi:Mg2+ and Co2+ transporter CorA
MNSIREVFAGSISLRMSDTMRILTVFSVILLPLSFVTRIFSMSGFDLENVSYSLLIFWRRGWIFVREGYNVIDILDDNKKRKR